MSKLFIEICSGLNAPLSCAANDAGWEILPIDFKRGGESQNLLNPEVEAKLSDLIPHAHLVHFAPPCSTFSTIMFLNKWSSRTVEYPLGGGKNRATDPREIEANKILDCCCRLAKICDAFSIPWTWENPARSLMWKTPQLLSLLATNHTTAHVDWCAYGLPWKKTTYFRGRGVPWLIQLERHCNKNHKHEVLMGIKEKSIPKTELAAEYAPEFCKLYFSSLDIYSYQ